MLKGALERFGEKDYRAAVQHLIKALGDDLASMRGSSVPAGPAERRVAGPIFDGSARHDARGCQKLVARMGYRTRCGPPRRPAVSCRIWPARAVSAGAIPAASPPSPTSTVPTLARLLELPFSAASKPWSATCPLKVFADADARSNVLDAAQGALDAAVTLEEEAS